MKSSTYTWRSDWRVTLGIVFIGQLFTSMGFSIIFPFLPLYVKQLGSTVGMSVELLAGLVIAITGLTMAIASPFWGAVADRVGRKPMVLRATIGGTVVIGLMGMVQNAEQLILLRAIQGAITGTVAANNALVAAVAPRERMGFAMGTLQMSLWAGVALGPLLGGILADSYGFAMPFFITAGLLGFASLLLWFGIEEQFTPNTKTLSQQPKLWQQWKHVISAQGVPTMFTMRFMAGLGRSMLVPIAPLFIVALLPLNADHTNTYTGLATSLASMSATISGILLGRYGDAIGHRVILFNSALFAALCYFPQTFVHNYWLFLGFQVLAGIGIGGILSSLSALLAQYTEQGEEGAVYGIDNAIVSSSQAVAPLVGAGIALVFGLRGTFALTALLFMATALFAYYRLPRKRPFAEAQFSAAIGD